MKVFDVISFKKYMDQQVEKYALYVIGTLEKNNPGWLEKAKKGLIKEDGTPIEFTKEQEEQRIKETLSHQDWKQDDVDVEVLKELFIVDEKLLNKYIIE